MRKSHRYLFALFFFIGCKEKDPGHSTESSSFVEKPVTVSLDLKDGYKINPLTGDSIKPLINSSGKIIQTGAPYSIMGKKVDAPGIKNPKIINDDSRIKTIIETNIHPVQGKPETVPASLKEIQSIALPGNRDSIIVSDSSYILFTRKTLTVTNKKIALHEPQPIKIQPMRYKDNAILDIQYLDIGQGLVFSYIYAVYQDKTGNLWLGTDYGLCKYDGTYLTTYTEKDGLINNKVNSITGDQQGRLWIGTYGGVSVFDGNSFTRFSDKDGLLTNTIGEMRQGLKGTMWITIEDIGVVEFDGNTFIFYSAKNNFRETVSPEFLVDSKGVFWFLTHTGLIRYDEKRFVYFNPGMHILDKIIRVSEDSKGNTWFSSNLYGITKYDGNFFTHYTKDNGLSDNPVTSLMIDRKDNIWIGTRYKGLNKFDGKIFTAYSNEQGLSENKIICTIEDQQENIWIGTSGGGINKLNDEGFSEKFALDKLNNSRVRPIIKDKMGQLWFGTESGGLYSYNGTNLVKHLDRNVFDVRGFRSVLVDKDDNLWFGEHDWSGFYKYDFKQFRYYSPPRKVSSNLSLYEDRNGTIWIGTSLEGVAAFDGTTLTYYSESEGFSANRVFVTLQDKKNNLWFGTEGGGLVRFDGKMFTVFSEKQGLFAKSVTSIIEDEYGNLWLGTFEAGLCKFDGNSFTYYTQKQGLAFNTIWSVKEDAKGQIWAGTDNGLSVLIPQKIKQELDVTDYTIYSFGLQDGLKATDFNLNGVCIDNSNRIWWGTGKALITRDLNIPFIPDTPQSLKLSQIEINGQFRDYRNLSESLRSTTSFSSIQPFQNYPEGLSLPYDQNHLTFHFSSIDWSAPDKVKYSYRLLGLDNNWSHPLSDPFADYRNLTHGQYELQIKAIGQSQVWTDIVSYQFTIRPAWWQTWWFKTIVIVFAITQMVYIMWLIYLYRLRKQRTLLEKQLAVQYERQRISSEMHDDIGAGLSGVRLLTEMTRNKLKGKGTTDEIDKIYESVGDISAKMKEVIWSLDTGNDSISNLVYYIQKQVKAQLENYPGELIFDIPETIPDLKIAGEKRRNIYLLVKEAVHNIIKHSGADKIRIAILFNHKMIISVWDNGKGFDLSQNYYTGNGMKNMHNRVQQINGQLNIKNANGTTLIFEIPVKNIL